MTVRDLHAKALPSLLLVLAMTILALWCSPASARAPFRVDIFDANRTSMGGVVLPLTTPDRAPLTGGPFRAVSRVAADGVTLLLLRAKVPTATSVEFTLQPGTDGASAGALYPVDALGVLDTSAAGGQVDGQKPGPLHLAVPTVEQDGARYAFALYRSPRNFDGKATASLNSRAIQVLATAGSETSRRTLTVVRPLVLLLHGTVNNPANWADFPLWKEGGNELAGYKLKAGGVPFQVDRLSYQWISLADGPIVENGQTTVEQIERCLENWRRVTRTAGTQVDVITHSYGGPVARQAAQTQPDPDPMTLDCTHNFRSGANWGHGAIHKLITLAGSHRGGGWVTVFTYLNHFSQKGPGAARKYVGDTTGIDIAAGAPRDEVVCSAALMNLKESMFPSHAFIGSGMLSVEGADKYAPPLTYREFQTFDAVDGPYQAAGNALESPRNANRLSNFVSNLDYDTPAVAPPPASTIVPDRDLIVESRSGTGHLPRRAVTTVNDLDPSGRLVGHLSHSEFLASAASRQNPPNILVSRRIAMLLRQSTTSPFFARFPANKTIPPDAAEQESLTRRFHGEPMFDPAYLDEGETVQNPPPFPNPGFPQVRVHPSRLVLHGTSPSPLLVYGRKGDAWPFVQSLSDGTWCKLTITSSNPAVVDVQIQPATQIPVPYAKRPGTAVLTVTVDQTPGQVRIPVRVEGLPVQAVSLPAGKGFLQLAFLGSPGFDVRDIQPETVRVNGQRPSAFETGSVVRMQDVNRDGRPDAVVQIPVPRSRIVHLDATWKPAGYPAETATFIQAEVRRPR